MLKKERAQVIINRLDELYPSPPIPLVHKDTFTLLVAVILSAQSTDKKVNQLTPALFDLGYDPESMVRLGKENILKLIKQLGLSKQKAENIYKTSKILLKDYSGEVPRNFKDLESLPGVGHKTASVVMAQAFNVPTFPIDTHIHRLAQRWGLSRGKNVQMTERDLKSIFPQELWNKLHLQFIYYGREHCTARGCDGTICNLCRELFPLRRSAKICNKP